ncbi:MAG: DUF1127 domain-containing protein [Alphaproteobacteria bacterium]|nr:DUF1127 domain-containing protein [Alphaproteobacteria bacterium]
MTTEKIWVFRTGLPVPPRLRLRDLGACASRFFELLDAWRQHVRDRHELLSLSDHTLKDIGISRATAERAAKRSFWGERL